ncbi:YHS domain-containing protein [Glycomyces paridis]|uniref:YHS domain-containing protein n=1 Tax=Glycomyces paridis TaxID=2126555 RepID=A0A4S8PF94_9ACTN|nr:YHS domain-containing protein [Glycomyces paridis]THV29070.1 YHS domain-containing protein [Glycomyces paridis]
MCSTQDKAAEACHAPVDADEKRPEELAECPVMTGSTVVKADAEAAGLFRDFEGERYWFCCAGCGPAFDADPAKYARAA